MLEGVLQRGDLTEPGPVLRLDQVLGRVHRHLLDARELGRIDAQETALYAGVFVDTGRAVGAVAVTEGGSCYTIPGFTGSASD